MRAVAVQCFYKCKNILLFMCRHIYLENAFNHSNFCIIQKTMLSGILNNQPGGSAQQRGSKLQMLDNIIFKKRFINFDVEWFISIFKIHNFELLCEYSWLNQ